MTDRRRRSKALPVYVAATVAFATATSGLAWQMSSGRDPALGDSRKTVAAVAAPAPRRVLIRRIETTVVVTRVLPAITRIAGAPAPSPGAPARSAPSPAAVRASAPAAGAAPAPPPVAAPAPAPAPPLVTRSS